MVSGGRIPWNAIAVCEMSNNSWQTVKTPYSKDDLENHSKDQSYRLGHWGIWKGDILISRSGRIAESWMHQILVLEESTRKKLIRQTHDEFKFPFADGTAKLSRRDYEFENPLQGGNQPWGAKISAELHGELNRQKPQMTLEPVPVDPRWLHQSSSQMNFDFNSTCRRKKHSLFHWNVLTCPDWSKNHSVYFKKIEYIISTTLNSW